MSKAGLLADTAKRLAKEFGDEVADLYRRYVDNGYPESVAERIATGQLDPSFEARMARAREQGYDINQIWYHGSPDKFLEFSPDSIQKRFDASIGHHFSNAENEAKHYAGIGGNVGDYLVKSGKQIKYNIDDNPIEASNFLTASMKADWDRDRIVEDILNGGFDSALISKTMPESWQDWGAVNKNLIKMGNEGIRSYSSAMFDPEYKGPNILGSLAATGGALGLLAAPEDAEAGPAKIAKSVLDDVMRGVMSEQDAAEGLIKLGATPEQAYGVLRGTISPSKIGVKSGDAGAIPIVGSSGGLIDPRFDPRVNSRARNAGLSTDIISRGTMDNIPRIKLSDLEGQRFVTSMSDRTNAGGLLSSINGVELNNLINLQGGQGFMFENPGMVWASAQNPVNQILAEAGGSNTLYLPWRMAPTGGDFATKTGETMLSYASANMSKAEKKKLDKLIKNYVTTGTWDKKTKSYKGAGLRIKDWKGVDDPSSIEAWRSAPDALRKELKNAMDVQFRDSGGLTIGEARLAVTDPIQRYAIDGGIQNVGQIFGDQRAIIGSGHPSYPYGVPGQGIGQLDQQAMTIFDLIPDARIGKDQVRVADVVDPTNPHPEALRALQMKPYSGVINESVLKTLQNRGVDVGAYAATPAGLLTESQDRALESASSRYGDALTLEEQAVNEHQRAVDEQMMQMGLLSDPMYEYGTLLPKKTNIVTGESSLAYPEVVRDVVRGLLDIGTTRRTGVYNPNAFVDVML